MLRPAPGSPTPVAGLAVLVRNDTAPEEPCGGAVFAVPAGDPDPRLGFFSAATYVESYRFTDVNARGWIVDKWLLNGRFVWTAPILGNVWSAPYPGGDCASIQDDPCGGGVTAPHPNPDPGVVRACADEGYRDPGTHGQRYPCGTSAAPCPKVSYNALLLVLLEDLAPRALVKDHRDGSMDLVYDSAGCHATLTPTWPCPAGDDDREGNSHAYAPDAPYPILERDGRGLHGRSADCTSDTQVDVDCHATAQVDLYYGPAPNVLPRNDRIADGDGYEAPFHCQSWRTVCNADDL